MKFKLITDHPVALHSPDHADASWGGSGTDNSTNPRFNAKLKALFGEDRLRVLDLGCAGGGFVKSLLDGGHSAVGLEGSDYSLKNRRAEWATVPDNLFTCDVTRPFTLLEDVTGEGHYGRCPFDLVTAWEVMEHIAEDELPQLVDNVLGHLRRGGMWVMSVSTTEDGHFHRCVRPMGWWVNFFAGHGLVHLPAAAALLAPDWVRGPDPTPWAVLAPDSFHLVLGRDR